MTAVPRRQTDPGDRIIRRATPADRQWVLETSADVYASLGDYQAILPDWIDNPAVLTFVEQDEDGARRGFLVLGFYRADDQAEGDFVADLLAIAVASRWQRSGVGRRLLQHALDLSVLAAQRKPVREVRLTVADSNVAARKLFASEGFVVMNPEHGRYDLGQTAVRMRRSIPQPARRWSEAPDD